MFFGLYILIYRNTLTNYFCRILQQIPIKERVMKKEKMLFCIGKAFCLIIVVITMVTTSHIIYHQYKSNDDVMTFFIESFYLFATIWVISCLSIVYWNLLDSLKCIRITDIIPSTSKEQGVVQRFKLGLFFVILVGYTLISWDIVLSPYKWAIHDVIIFFFSEIIFFIGIIYVLFIMKINNWKR